MLRIACVFAALIGSAILAFVVCQAGADEPPAIASRMAVARQPVAFRMARADAVIVGKVRAIAAKPVAAAAFPKAPNPTEYRIADVSVEETIVGAEGLTDLKVGFAGVTGNTPILRGTVGRPQTTIRAGGAPAAMLVKDQEGLFFLTRHHAETFYTVATFSDVVDRKSPEFPKELAEAKKVALLLAEPEKGLKSTDADERLLTAALLIVRYREQRAGYTKMQPIDAQQSKQILAVLAQADWGPVRGPATQMSPLVLFTMLGLTREDGWVTPGEYRQFPDEAKKWIREHGDSYRILRLLPEEGGVNRE